MENNSPPPKNNDAFQEECAGQLQLLINSTPDLIWMKDLDGVFLYCNETFARFFNHSVQEIIGNTEYSLVYKELANYFRANDKRAIDAEKPCVNEEWITNRVTNKRHLFETIKTPVYDKNGVLVGVSGIARDITERALAQLELKAEEERYKQLSNATFEAIFLSDRGICLAQNKTAREMFDYSDEEAIGRKVTAWIHPDSRETHLNCLVSDTHSPLFEAVAIRKDGSTFQCEIQTRIMRIDGMKFKITALRDITERKHAEQALKQSQERLNTALHAVRDGVWDLDLISKEVYFSPRWFTMLDYEPFELPSTYQTFIDLLHPDDVRKSTAIMDKHMEGGLPIELEFRLRARNGAYRWIFSRGKAVAWDETGKAIRSLGTHVDITNRIHTEQELTLAKERAESANLAKSEFLANMSHEIRTPLNGVIGMLQLIELTQVTQEQKEYTNAALQSSKRLNQLLNDLLDISKAEAGKLILRNEAFSLKDVVKDTRELFLTSLTEKKLQFTSHLDPALPDMVRGDSIRLLQILTNLVGNAIKFTHQGSISLDIYSLTATTPGQSRVLFQISDTGIGIAQDKIDQLFGAFTQASEGFARSHQGAGLGLAICNRLVSLMNGQMSLESEEEKGTTFYFTMNFDCYSPKTKQHA